MVQQEHANNVTHFVGVGGAGMSGLARILLEQKKAVSGSDLNTTAVTRKLEEMGAQIFQGHNVKNLLPKVNRVIISSAIPEENEEVLEAKERGLPIVQRAELLAELMQEQKSIAVAGAHGKTTTTSMIAVVLTHAEKDPTIIVGGELNDIGGNAKLGYGDYLVAEADESDGSFLKLKPDIAVVTNVEDDHLDYYGSVDKLKAAFREFLEMVPAHGLSVTCWDDPFLQELAQSRGSSHIIGYGLKEEADYAAEDINFLELGSESIVSFRGDTLGKLKLQVPGRHNLSNALAAVAVGHQIGIPFVEIAEALGNFRGVCRRFQMMGKKKGVIVIDDYAHHPTEVKATLSAAKRMTEGRVVVLFQPHRYSRTKLLYKEFGNSFADADILILTDIYAAGEKPIPGINSDLIYEKVKEYSGTETLRCSNLGQAVELAKSMLSPGDVLLTIGAGDVWKAGSMLIKTY